MRYKGAPNTTYIAPPTFPKPSHNHDGPKPIIPLKSGGYIWAGSKAEVAGRAFELVLQLVDMYWKWEPPYQRVRATDNARNIMPADLFPDPRPTIQLDWEDFGTPFGINRPWWETFLAGCEAIPGKPNIAVCCDGGHGRTGTAMVILGCLAGVIPEDRDPVTWLRQLYCERVVETREQLAYITRITGRTTTSVPNEPPVVISGSKWGKSAQASATVFTKSGDGMFPSYSHLYEDDPEEMGIDEDGNVYGLDPNGRVVVIGNVHDAYDATAANSTTANPTPNAQVMGPAEVGPGATSPPKSTEN